MSDLTLQNISDTVLSHAAAVIKCLGHPLRLRLLEALEDGEKTVSQLQVATGASQAAVSQQLATLRGRAIVDCRRDGTNVFYWVIEPKVSRILDCLRECDVEM